MRAIPLPKIKLSAFRGVVAFGFLLVSLLAWSVVMQSGRTVAAASLAACTPTGTTYGTDTMSVAIPSADSYHIWVRLQMPSTSSSSPLLLNMDSATGTNCYAVDGSSVTAANTWTWVEATAGLTAPTLTASDHTLVVTGTQSGASLDRIEFLNDSTCVPTGTGDNCTTAANTAPTISVTGSASGATVSGTTNITATAVATTSGAIISSVQFKVDGTNVGSADTTSPYSYNWNTSGVSNGTHTITAVATDSNNLTTTSSSITVTVDNAPTCTTGTLSAPTNLTQASSTYTSIGLSWTAPSPTAGCTITGYKVFRDGTQVSTPTGTSFTNTGLTASNSYTYTVEATDSGNNTSVQSSSKTFTTVADNEAPNAPGNPGATAAGAGQIDLTWSASTDNPSPGGVGVDGYNVYRCTGTSCTPSTTASTPVNGSTLISGTSYNDTTVSASTGYSYVITAVDNVGNESSPSTVVHATTPAPTCSGNPTQPGSPAAGTRTITSVSFSWAASTASAGCTLSGYHIYQVSGSTYTLVSTVTSGTSTTITGLTPNTSYIYAVEAYDTSGHTSDKTQTAAHITIATLADTTAPTAPGLVTATAASASQVNLSWSASTDNVGVTGYKIYRCSGSSCTSFSLLTTISGTSTLSYSDTSVAASTSYTYEVSAVDAAGNESAKTSSNSVTTPAAAGTTPAAPTSAKAPVIATQGATLTWTAPTGTVTGYHVYINGVLDTYSKDTFTSTGGTLSCLAPSVSYTITVKAYNSAGSSPAATVTVPTLSGGLAGDFNCDQSVNGFDLNALATDWNMSGMLPTGGDANGDATVNGFDLNAVATNWNKSL